MARDRQEVVTELEVAAQLAQREVRRDPRDQLLGREGFYEVVVGPDLESLDLCLLAGTCRQQDDRDLLGLGVGAQSLQ